MLEEKIEGYREGIVVKELIFRTNLLLYIEDTIQKALKLQLPYSTFASQEVFRYIEIFCENGVCYYVYEDEKGYALFEKNFMSNRFTSYHDPIQLSPPRHIAPVR